MLAEIAGFVNRLVSRYYSNTPQNTEEEPTLEKHQGRRTQKFQIRGWATRQVGFELVLHRPMRPPRFPGTGRFD